MKKRVLLLPFVFIVFHSFFSFSQKKEKLNYDPLIIKQEAEKIAKENPKILIINQKKYRTDCSTFVRKVYYNATGLDLIDLEAGTKIFRKTQEMFYQIDGAVFLYILFSYYFAVDRYPQVGDVVFFDNTFDKNRNKRWDDVLTHVGIVTEVDNEGTAVFIHAGTSKGIEKGVLNLAYPLLHQKGGKIINSYIQRPYSWSKNTALAGALVRGFGRIE